MSTVERVLTLAGTVLTAAARREANMVEESGMEVGRKNGLSSAEARREVSAQLGCDSRLVFSSLFRWFDQPRRREVKS